MKVKNAVIATLLSSVIGVAGANSSPSFASATGQAQDAGQPAIARRIGAIKAINGSTIALAPESGPEVAVTVQSHARLLRIAPREKGLKNATPLQSPEVQGGDTIRVRRHASHDCKSIPALEIIVITHS